MAFPAELNFNYYRGDTLEFKVYPKINGGTEKFDLSNFTGMFKIATVRGADGLATQKEGLAYIDAPNGVITCVLQPDTGKELVAGTTYVYDIQIKNNSYKVIGTDIIKGVFTVLTGTITVTDDVSETYNG